MSLDPPGGEPTDAQLLAAHVAGDADAFGTLVRRHTDRLWAVALRTLGDREEAADALQDALLSAYRRAATFRGESAVTTWLHRVVVNACLDRMRRRAARPVSPLPAGEIADARDELASAETRLDVRAALDTLPEHQRTALVLVDMHGMSVAEAAAVLDVAEGTVKSRCSRGRAALVPLLAPRLAVPGGPAPSASPEPGAPPATPPGDPGNRTAGADVPPAATSTSTSTDQRDGGRP